MNKAKVIASGFGLSAFVGGPTFYAMAAFFASLQHDFRMSFAAVSLAFGVQSVVMGIAAAPMGRMLERGNIRVLASLGVLVAALGFVLLGESRSALGVYTAFGLTGLGSTTTTFLLVNTIVAATFEHNVGLMLGIVQTGYGVGGFAATFAVYLIHSLGWRPTTLVVASMMVAVGIPFTRMLPSRVGFNAHHPVPDRSTPESAPLRGERTRATLRLRAFWIIAIILTLSSAITAAIFAHAIRAMETFGFRSGLAGTVAGITALVGITGRIGMGWIAGWVSSRYLLAGALGMQAAGVGVFAIAGHGSRGLLIVFAALFGLGQGSIFVLSPLVQKEYFGAREFATIQGLLLAPSMVLAGMFPVAIGVMVDSWGSYRPGFEICAFVGTGLMILMMVTRRPNLLSLGTTPAPAGLGPTPDIRLNLPQVTD